MTLPQPSKYPGPVRLLLGAFFLLSGLGKALDVAQFTPGSDTTQR